MNIAILGAGRIAGIMAQTVNGMAVGGKNVRLYAIASRELDRAEKFAREYGAEKAYGSYEEMAEDPSVDLVYIAVPHSHHYETVKLCLEKGRHVLCEKAFTVNARQARELIELAEGKRLLLTEAIWTRYQPMRRTIQEMVSSGIVGEPRTVTANLCYAIMDKPRVVDPALAGGALLDIGVYTLNFAEMIFGRPDKIEAVCLKMDSGVDRADNILLTWEDGRTALLNAAVDSVSDRDGVIYGTKGFIRVENINNPQRVSAYDDQYRLIREERCPDQITGYEYEVEEALDTISKGRTECPSMPHEETIHIMEEMDEIRRQCKIRLSCE